MYWQTETKMIPNYHAIMATMEPLTCLPAMQEHSNHLTEGDEAEGDEEGKEGEGETAAEEATAPGEEGDGSEGDDDSDFENEQDDGRFLHF